MKDEEALTLFWVLDEEEDEEGASEGMVCSAIGLGCSAISLGACLLKKWGVNLKKKMLPLVLEKTVDSLSHQGSRTRQMVSTDLLDSLASSLVA